MLCVVGSGKIVFAHSSVFGYHVVSHASNKSIDIARDELSSPEHFPDVTCISRCRIDLQSIFYDLQCVQNVQFGYLWVLLYQLGVISSRLSHRIISPNHIKHYIAYFSAIIRPKSSIINECAFVGFHSLCILTTVVTTLKSTLLFFFFLYQYEYDQKFDIWLGLEEDQRRS